MSIEEQLTTICKHNREKKECKTCKTYCQHDKRKSRCIKCGGSAFCEHKQERGDCIPCGGSGICEHKKRYRTCILCGGSGICEHKIRRSKCIPCDGSEICEHKRDRSKCIPCNGSGICEHKRDRRNCHLCEGSGICEHKKLRFQCQICEPIKYLIQLQRHQIWRVMKQTNIEKTQPSIEYLGCSAVYFKEYISKKMTDDMTFDNIHYDHIKPISVFDLDNHDELLKCCHYTNFQPLLATDNLEKSNKWNDETDAFWRENICGKEYLEIYNPF